MIVVTKYYLSCALMNKSDFVIVLVRAGIDISCFNSWLYIWNLWSITCWFWLKANNGSYFC